MHKLLNEARQPTLDAQNLRKLARDVCPDAVESFAANYTDHLPGRVDRVVRTVGDRNLERAMDATLSLKTASSLVGALRMTQLCRELELALASEDLPEAGIAAHEISLHLPDLQEALVGRPALEPEL